jgi:Xaa-Pro dipeptidase
MVRLQRLTQGLRDQGCGAAVLVGADHAAHLASYTRLYSGPVALVVTAEGERTLVAPIYEVPIATAQADVDHVMGYGPDGFGLEPDPTPALIGAIADRLPAGRVAIVSGDEVSAAAAHAAGTDAVDVSALVHDIRLLKDPDEQAKIARAVQLALAGQAAVARDSVSGASEIALYTSAFAAAQLEAGAPIEFGGDLLAGERTASVCGPVAVAGGRRPEDGDVVISDLSARLDGYWGDTARTHIVGVHPEATAAREFIRGLLTAAAAELRPGVTAASVFDSMNGAILERYPEGRFPHHGGHGLGLTPFEDPHVIPGDETPLQEGMVIALEPGVYFPGRFGVRVENVFAVTAGGGVDICRLRDH